MGTKNSKGTVSIENIGKRIRLRWRFQKMRFSLSLFHFTKTSLQEAKKISILIDNDMLAGTFDASLGRYKPAALLPALQPDKSLVEHFEVWVKEYRNMDCEKDIDYYSTRSMMKRWAALMNLL